MIRSTVLLAASLLMVSLGAADDKSPDPLRALESKMHGAWKGDGPCDGDLVLAADGTYKRQHFSPQNNSLTGTWTVRWDALPPTLVLKCETSDRPFFAGRTTELKLLQLNEDALIYQYPQETTAQYNRLKE